jgi:FMN reductase
VQQRVARSLRTLLDRAEEFQRQEDAIRERDALLSRASGSAEPLFTPWPTRDVRWSV